MQLTLNSITAVILAVIVVITPILLSTLRSFIGMLNRAIIGNYKEVMRRRKNADVCNIPYTGTYTRVREDKDGVPMLVQDYEIIDCCEVEVRLFNGWRYRFSILSYPGLDYFLLTRNEDVIVYDPFDRTEKSMLDGLIDNYIVDNLNTIVSAHRQSVVTDTPDVSSTETDRATSPNKPTRIIKLKR